MSSGVQAGNLTTAETRPVRGPMFRQVVAIGAERIGGMKRTRLLALLAAYADAGESSPSARVLVRTLGLPGGHGRRIDLLDALLVRLERDGWLRIEREPGKRNTYTLTLDREPA